MHPTVGCERVEPREGRGVAEGSAFDSDCRRFFDRVLVEGVRELAVVRAVAGIGQEHRMGRWWRLKGVKNGIFIQNLNLDLSV